MIIIIMIFRYFIQQFSSLKKYVSSPLLYPLLGEFLNFLEFLELIIILVGWLGTFLPPWVPNLKNQPKIY